MCYHKITYYRCPLCNRQEEWRRLRVACAKATGSYGFGSCSAWITHSTVKVVVETSDAQSKCEACKTQEAKGKIEQEYIVSRGGT